MIDQMYSKGLTDRIAAWDTAYYEWAFAQTNGLINPLEWIRANGSPSSSAELSAAFTAMQRENRTKEAALRTEYGKTNPYPVQRYRGAE